MPNTRNSAAQRGGKKGNFAESRNGLLSLFDDSDRRSDRNWRESFGYERRPEEPKRAKPFIAREARKSSSDSR